MDKEKNQVTNESRNLEKINTSKNKIGYNFENYNKIVKCFNEIEAEWKGDVSLGPLEGEVLTLYVEHPSVKDLVAFDEQRIIGFISKKANIQLAKIKPVIYIDNI